MKLEFDDLDQLAEFAHHYVTGVRANSSHAGAAFAGPPSRVKVALSDLGVGEYGLGGKDPVAEATANKIQRDILQCAMKDTGLTEEELTGEQLTGNPDTGVGPANSTDEAPAHMPDDEVTFDKVTIPDEAPEGENVQAEPPKRKRRTKAEIAADHIRAADGFRAAPEGRTMEVAEAIAEQVEDDGVAEVAAIATQVATTAASLATEAEAKVQAARAVYTLELVETLRGHAELFDNDRKAHLVEARDAISKKGFIAYNATMQGLGLGPSVATYSDDEVKLHRAAIAHLLAS